MNIEIIKQPEWLSYEEIASVLHDAHQSTLQAGMKFLAATATGEQIRRRLGETGTVFAAMDGKNVAGVIGVVFYPANHSWFWKSKPYAELKIAGVRTAYKGKGISHLLYKEACDFAFKSVDLITMNTSEKNRIVIDSNEHHGWIKVDYKCFSITNYYSVVMAKWKKDCPFSPFYRTLQYQLRRMLIRLRFRPGRIKRFGI